MTMSPWLVVIVIVFHRRSGFFGGLPTSFFGTSLGSSRYSHVICPGFGGALGGADGVSDSDGDALAAAVASPSSPVRVVAATTPPTTTATPRTAARTMFRRALAACL